MSRDIESDVMSEVDVELSTIVLWFDVSLISLLFLKKLMYVIGFKILKKIRIGDQLKKVEMREIIVDKKVLIFIV